MANQQLPIFYRVDYLTLLNTIYDEKEYEFNDKLILKKLASLFVTIATGNEPENFSAMIKVLQKWHEDQLTPIPKQQEKIHLLNIAFKIVESFKFESIITLA